MSKEECQICVSKYTKSVHKKISCPNCQVGMCLVCCKKYLLESKEFPHCMACKQSWTRMFLYNNFPKTWIHGEYKSHREDLLEERHNAMLPMFHPHIVSKNREREYFQEIEELRSQINKLNQRVRILSLWANDEQLFYSGVTQTQPDPKDIRERRRTDEDIKKIEEDARLKREKTMMSRGPCPNTDCRGFISDDWKCGICRSKICSHCMLEIEKDEKDKSDDEKDKEKNKEKEKHICKEEDVASAEQIRKDCKNCPNCRIRIFKIEGCNQMFCTMCKKFFRWDNLEIIRGGPVHNPHYVEYMRTRESNGNRDENQNNSGNVCERNIRINDLRLTMAKSQDEYKIIKGFQALLRQVFETTDYINNTRQNTSIDDLNRELALRYLCNQITPESRKELLQKRQKEIDKLIDTNNVRELWTDQIKTHLYNFKEGVSSLNETVKNINAIEEYCKNAMNDIGNWYNSKPPKLSTRY
jgi:hypothetical protein